MPQGWGCTPDERGNFEINEVVKERGSVCLRGEIVGGPILLMISREGRDYKKINILLKWAQTIMRGRLTDGALLSPEGGGRYSVMGAKEKEVTEK